MKKTTGKTTKIIIRTEARSTRRKPSEHEGFPFVASWLRVRTVFIIGKIIPEMAVIMLKQIALGVVLLAGLLVGTVWADDALNKALFEVVGFNGDKAKVEALISKGADVNARDIRGYTTLIYAAGRSNVNIEVIELLISKGADVNAKIISDTVNVGDTPLHEAAAMGRMKVSELLISKGADVNAKNDFTSWTPLHRAASSGFKEVAEHLISRGADVNAKDHYLYTPLFWASNYERKEVVELLLSRGADVNAKGLPEVVEETSKKKNEIGFLLQAAMQKQDETASLLRAALQNQAGNHREAFNQVMTNYKGRIMSDPIRRPFITLSAKLKPTPEVPEEARKYLIRGNALMGDAKNQGEARAAITEYQSALLAAPWWGDAYFNLSKAQELAGDLDGTITSMQYYLLTEPPDKREAQDRLYGIEAKRDKARGK